MRMAKGWIHTATQESKIVYIYLLCIHCIEDDNSWFIIVKMWYMEGGLCLFCVYNSLICYIMWITEFN